MERIGEIVVAYPVFEKIAEDIQRVSAARLAFDKGEKRFVCCGPALAEMEIRDEEIQIYLPLTSFADSMITGWRGTSRFIPCVPVGVAAILLTTSIPLTTLPNTV